MAINSKICIPSVAGWLGLRAILFSFAMYSHAHASLIINEIFRGDSLADDYVEFLVTSNITLQELDSLWFGDSDFFTTNISRENTFNSSEIIAGSSYFESTSDTILAGSIVVAGGSNLIADLNYSPTTTNITDADAWNLTLTSGSGITTTTGSDPFDLGGFGDVVWLSESRPTSGSGTDDFVSAVSYGWFQGAIAQDIQAQEDTGDTGFQALESGVEWDGIFETNNSLSNQSGEAGVIDFAMSESVPITVGDQNGGSNEELTYDLRAVPEPSTVIPCLLIAGFAITIYFRNRQELSAESANQPS